jgi:hypothetical protein
MGKKYCRTLKDIHDGIVDYISENTTYESNKAIDEVIVKLDRIKNMDEIFRIPIENRMFSFDTSLNWLFFIHVTSIYVKEQITVPSHFNPNFSCQNAMKYITDIYDAKTENIIFSYYDSESEMESNQDSNSETDSNQDSDTNADFKDISGSE